MSNPQSEAKTKLAQPRQSSAPDGKSPLPSEPVDFPNPGTGDSGPTGSQMPK